jgi:4'-phosphopantetheinyl transferase EntD
VNASDFENFQLIVQQFIADQINEDVRFYSCQVTQKVDLRCQEIQLIKKAVPKRVYEFSAGRYCARRCLSFYGAGDFEILQGKYGEPLWPDGITGSISHHAGMAFAVSIPLDRGYIGIDIIDCSEGLPNPETVLNEAEIDNEICSNSHNGELLLFSLKESVIKILSPLLQEYVEFKDIEIKLVEEEWRVSYRAEILNVDLHWLCHDQYAITMALMNP